MMWCGQSRMPLLDAQHSKDAGWTGRTHSTPHIMHVTCGLDNTKALGSRGFCGRQQEDNKTQDTQQMHGYDFDHIDLDISDIQAVKHRFPETRTQPSACFTQVVLAHTLRKLAGEMAEIEICWE